MQMSEQKTRATAVTVDDRSDQISQSKDNILHKLDGTIEDNVLFDSNVSKKQNRESLKKTIRENYGLDDQLDT